jgi:hypothetical protein
MTRATPQWFADVEAVKPRALAALDKVDFYPPQCESSSQSSVYIADGQPVIDWKLSLPHAQSGVSLDNEAGEYPFLPCTMKQDVR